jgi:hypothetical protein
MHLEEEIASLPGIHYPAQPGKPEFGSVRGSGRDDEHIALLLESLREVNELFGAKPRLRVLLRPHLSALHPGHVFDILHTLLGCGQGEKENPGTLMLEKYEGFDWYSVN